MLPQCRKSAEDFRNLMIYNFGLPAKNVAYFFDSDLAPSVVLTRIEDWLSEKSNLINRDMEDGIDLIVYYTGHGGFTGGDQSFFLATRQTRSGSEGSTSIRFIDLASIIKRRAAGLRRYFILDCCFAGAAVQYAMASPMQMMLDRAQHQFPAEGTAFLCSSSRKKMSMAPAGLKRTMFSDVLIDFLTSGLDGGPPDLSFVQIGDAVQHQIAQKHKNEAIRPELHVPDQEKGNIAVIPLFPNVAYSGGIASIGGLSAKSGTNFNVLSWRDALEWQIPISFVLGVASSAISTTAYSFYVNPLFYIFTSPQEKKFDTSGLTFEQSIQQITTLSLPERMFFFSHPGLAFGLALAVLMFVRRRISGVRLILVVVSSYVAWTVAWNVGHDAMVSNFMPQLILNITAVCGALGAFIQAALILVILRVNSIGYITIAVVLGSLVGITEFSQDGIGSFWSYQNFGIYLLWQIPFLAITTWLLTPKILRARFSRKFITFSLD